jgi:hypothetical protein
MTDSQNGVQGGEGATATATHKKAAPKKAAAKKVTKSTAGQPQSVKLIAQQATTLQKLLDETQKVQDNLRKAQQTRHKELLAEIDRVNKEHEQAVSGLRAELTPLEEALGLGVPQFDFTEVADAGSKAKTGIVYDAFGHMPKTLALPKSKKDNTPFCTPEFWNKLMVWPGKREDATMNSLGKFLALVCYNADGEEVNTPTAIAAVQAMGHETSGKTFSTSVSTQFTGLKKEGVLKEGSERGTHVITKDGRKWIEKVIKEIETGNAEAEAEAGGTTVKVTKTSEITLDDAILMAIQVNGGKLALNSVAGELGKVGYGFPADASVEAKMKAGGDALARLKNEKFITVNNEGEHTNLVLNKSGQKRVDALA